jgi:hypothetical protein
MLKLADNMGVTAPAPDCWSLLVARHHCLLYQIPKEWYQHNNDKTTAAGTLGQ